MSAPAIVMVPPDGSMRRLIIRSVVVFPQPDGPMSTTIDPPSTSRSRERTAGLALPGKVLVTPVRVMAVAPLNAPSIAPRHGAEARAPRLRIHPAPCGIRMSAVSTRSGRAAGS